MVGLTWLKVDLDFRKGRYFALEKDLQTLAELNPYSARVWDYAAWHKACNVARQATTPEEAFRHRCEGLGLVRQGLSLLPDDRLLLRRLGLIGLLLAEHDRARWMRQEDGRDPEAIPYEAFDRLRRHPDARPEDRIRFAGSARDLGVQQLARGAWTAAATTFRCARDALRTAAHAWEAAGQSPPPDLAIIQDEADGWCELAQAAARAASECARGRPGRAETDVKQARQILDGIDRAHPAAENDEHERRQRAGARSALGRLAARIENETNEKNEKK